MANIEGAPPLMYRRISLAIFYMLLQAMKRREVLRQRGLAERGSHKLLFSIFKLA